MNYFYFFFCIALSGLILCKPITKYIFSKILQKENLRVIGSLSMIIGLLLIGISSNYELWFERVWTLTTFVLGCILLLRGIFALIFPNIVKKLISSYFRNYYKFSVPTSMFLVLIGILIVLNDYIGPKKDISECISDKDISVICGFKNPEDMVITPDGKFLFISEFGGVKPYEDEKSGYFSLLEIKSSKKLVPNIKIAENTWGDKFCTRSESQKYGPHGIDLVMRNDQQYQIGVISHYPKETIEMFELVNENNEWGMIWRGCINVPEKYYFNDISLKKDGTFYASYMYGRDITLSRWLIAALLKKNTGYLVEWDRNIFKKIQNTDGSGPNGIALDEKKQVIYINYNKGDKISKFDLIANKEIESFSIESPDNPYISNNSVWVTSLDSQPNDLRDCEVGKTCSAPFSIFELDKDTLMIKNKFSYSKTVFGLPTIAVPFENKIYLGSFRSDRLGVIIDKQ